MAGELLKAKDILKIGQRVEFYVEDSNERYTSRIEDITENQLVVAMPMSRNFQQPVSSGCRIPGVMCTR